MTVIRISRTYPRENFPGMGLHILYFTKYINKKTIVFTKKHSGKPVEIPENLKLIEISYNDLPFRKKNESSLYLIVLAISKLWGELNFFIKIFYYLLKNPPGESVIHLHSINYLLSAVSLKKIFKIPLIVSFGGTDLIRVKQFKFLRWIIKKTDAVLYVARSMKNDLEDIFPNKQNIFHINNGVDLNEFKISSKFRKSQFVAIGNLRWQKGFDYLIEAFSMFNSNNPNFKLFIAGEGDEREKLSNLITRLKLNKKVYLLGTCSRKEIINLLSQSTALISSSVSEGLPKILIESIACGTPIITTRVGDCEYISKDVGISVHPKDVLSLYEAMKKIVNNNKTWYKYSTNCLVKREKYDWSIMASKVSKAYDFTLNEFFK